MPIRQPIAHPAPDPGANTTSSSAARRVLVVDDNQDSADSLTLLLEFEGYVARAAYSAKDAIEQVDAFVPDIILLDIGMPGMNGYDLAQHIKAKPAPPRLIAVSATANPRTRRDRPRRDSARTLSSRSISTR